MNEKLILALERIVYAETKGDKVEAGLKEILKAIGKFLLGVLMFTQTAFGIQMENPKDVGDMLAKSMNKMCVKTGGHDKYDVKVKETKSGKIQHVVFTFMKNNVEMADFSFSAYREVKVFKDYASLKI